MGVEGIFRRSSEMTMQLFRDHKSAVMSILTTFVHDPLIEWMRVPRVQNSCMYWFIIYATVK